MKQKVIILEFQFHKVRLKAPFERRTRRRNSFQFHKVRLKDIAGLYVVSLPVFQFHKVRLKALQIQR